MEGGKPEDISLLAGGADQPLIPVQGGGGFSGDHMKPWDNYNQKKSALLQQGASENPEITAMNGGGFLDFFLGRPPPPVAPVIPEVPQGEVQAFNSLWNSLDATAKVNIIKDMNEVIAEAKKNGADDTVISEIIPTTLLKNTLDAVDRQYGTNDANAEKLLKYGTQEQIEAGRKKYLELKAAGKTDEQTVSEVENEMARYVPTQATRIPQFAMGFLSQASQKTYRTFEDRIAYRNEYQFNISKPLDETHTMLIWLNKLELKYKTAERFGRYMNNYIQSQIGAWAVIKTATGKSPNSKMARLAGSTYVSVSISGDRRVTCLDKSIEHIVVIPPLEELKIYNDSDILDTTAILKMVLRDLYDLNLFVIDEEAGTCKINKKVALIFASAYTAEITTYRSVFLYMSTLEMQNKFNIFCMSNFSEYEVRAGLSLLNLIPNKEQSNIEIPTLLSPCGVLYPYKMKSNVDGIFVGCNFNQEYSASIFKEIHKSPYFGKQGCGVFVNDRASFVKSNRSILRYNYVLNREKTDFLAKIIIPETESLEELERFQREVAAAAWAAGAAGMLFPPGTADAAGAAGAGAVNPARDDGSVNVRNSAGKLKTVKDIRDIKGGDGRAYLSVKDDNIKLRIIIWGLFYVVDGLNKLGVEIRRILGNRFNTAAAEVAAAAAAAAVAAPAAPAPAPAPAVAAANPKVVNINLILNLLTTSAGRKDHAVYLFRGQFTVLMELFIYMRNNLGGIIDNLTQGPLIELQYFQHPQKLNTDLKKFLDEHIDSVTYTRFPLKGDYNHYIQLAEKIGKQKALSEIYNDITGLKTGLAVARGGGKGRKTTSKEKKKSRKLMIGGGHCGEKRVQGRAGPINMFELEQFAPYTICAFSIKKRESRDYEDGTGDVCREETERSKEMNGNFFTQWSVESEIADTSKLQIIDIADKTYAIRIPSDAVSCNWSGYKSKQMVMYTPSSAEDRGGVGPLLSASHIGDVETVRRLIEATPDLASSKDATSGMTALHVACQAGRIEVMKLLLEKNLPGVNEQATKSGKKTPLHFACENGRSGLVKALLEGVIAAAPAAPAAPAAAAAAPAPPPAPPAAPPADRNATLLSILGARADNGMTAIHFACKNGYVEVLNELLEKYPDANKPNALIAGTEDGKTPLYYACEGGHTSIVEILLRKMDNADEAISGAVDQSLSENSPLAIALKKGKSVVVDVFLRKISPDRLDGLFAPNTKNPLHFACEGGNLDVVKQVLNKRGANAPANIIFYSLAEGQAERKTSLHIACEKGHVEIVQELLSRVPNKPDAMNMIIGNERKNCLHIACEEGYTRVVQELLNAYGADADKTDAINTDAKDNKKPLHFACEGGHAEIVSELLSKLTDKTAALAEETNTQNRPLHLASKSGDAETVREILKAYADNPARLDAINLSGDGDKTPLHFACESEKKDGKVEVVKLLLDTITKRIGVDKTEIRNDLVGALNKPDGENKTKVLHAAAAADKGDEIIREILRSVEDACKDPPAGAEPANAVIRRLLLDKDEEEKTPLHIACKEGNVEAVKEILGFVKQFNEGKTDQAERIDFSQIINATAALNKTPLIIATENNLKSVVSVLIAQGADRSLRTPAAPEGKTALEIATDTPILNEVRDLLAAQQRGGGEGQDAAAGLGQVGASGDTGDAGASGDTGDAGASGDTGDAGASGDTGDQGASGDTGDQGASGDTGAQGDTGSQGDTGTQGDTGSQGDTGTQGDTGDVGATGDTGDDEILAIAAAAGIGALGIYALTKKGKVLPNIPVNPNPLAGGNMCDGIQQDIPVLVKGEADLLNDLNLTPTNMKEIFSSENHYANTFKYESLKSWGTALEMFFRNLTVQKCYENRLLLTISECEEVKCFLYSIRDYLENPANETEISRTFLKEGDTTDINEPSLETDTDIQLSKISIVEPRYSIFEGKPTVRVGAIEKATNKRVHFNLKLAKDSENKGQRFPTDAEIEELKAEFEKKQIQYKSKYVMYLY